MNNDRQLFLPRQIDLAAEPVALVVARLHILLPVVIETDLTDSDDLLLRGLLRQPGKGLLIQLTHVARMHTDGRIDKRILVRKLNAALCRRQIGSDIDDAADAGFLHTAKHGFTVFVKLLIIVMRMRFENHFNASV